MATNSLKTELKHITPYFPKGNRARPSNRKKSSFFLCNSQLCKPDILNYIIKL